jgi:hypothetical protein
MYVLCKHDLPIKFYRTYESIADVFGFMLKIYNVATLEDRSSFLKSNYFAVLM